MNRKTPKTFQVLVKTHKLTIFLTLPNTATFAQIKDEVLDALLDDVTETIGVPKPTSIDDFVIALSKGENKKGVIYEEVDDDRRLVDAIRNWDNVYIQFKNEDGGLLPVDVTLPSFEDDEEEDASTMDIDAPVESEVRRGKRKASP